MKNVGLAGEHSEHHGEFLQEKLKTGIADFSQVVNYKLLNVCWWALV